MMQPLLVNLVRPRMYRSAYRPMPYAPVLRGPVPSKQNKKLGAFSAEEVPTSLLIAGVGLGGFFLSNVLPAPWDWVAKGVSVALVGYAAYKVVAAPAAETAPPGTGAKVGPVSPIAKTEDFDSIQASFTTPKMYSTVPFGMFSGKYPVEVVVSYPWADTQTARIQQKPVTFILQLEAKETPYSYGGHLDAGEMQSGIVGSQQLTLNPGDQIPVSFNPSTIVSTWQMATITSTLTLYKIQSGGTGRVKLATVTFYLK